MQCWLIILCALEFMVSSFNFAGNWIIVLRNHPGVSCLGFHSGGTVSSVIDFLLVEEPHLLSPHRLSTPLIVCTSCPHPFLFRKALITFFLPHSYTISVNCYAWCAAVILNQCGSILASVTSACSLALQTHRMDLNSVKVRRKWKSEIAYVCQPCAGGMIGHLLLTRWVTFLNCEVAAVLRSPSLIDNWRLRLCYISSLDKTEDAIHVSYTDWAVQCLH